MNINRKNNPKSFILAFVATILYSNFPYVTTVNYIVLIFQEENDIKQGKSD